MIEHPSLQDLELYAGGSLSVNDFLYVDDHLPACEKCRNELARLKDVASKAASFQLQMADSEIVHLVYEDLESYVDGKCDETDREIIESHLEDCSFCSRQVSELERIARKQESFSGKFIFLWRSPQYSAPFRAVAAAAMIAFFALILSLIFHSSDRKLEARLQEEAEKNERARQDLRMAREKIAQLEDAGAPEALAISLADGTARIGLTESGTLRGGQSFPDRYRQLARTALQEQRIPYPGWAKDLAGASVTLMGRETPGRFRVESPVGAVVEADYPRFVWQPAGHGAGYHVEVFDSHFHLVASSGLIRDVSWTPGQALARGEIYIWKVVASVDGKEFSAPVPPAPEARFKVLEEDKLAGLNQARQNGSHLWLGLAYADSGMLPESKNEFQLLLRENPDSPLVQKLLQSLP